MKTGEPVVRNPWCAGVQERISHERSLLRPTWPSPTSMQVAFFLFQRPLVFLLRLSFGRSGPASVYCLSVSFRSVGGTEGPHRLHTIQKEETQRRFSKGGCCHGVFHTTCQRKHYSQCVSH